jgi:hypothetical protein
VIAALYVQKGGAYWDLPGVDPWDVTRDARKYQGPYPVVAHPPCQLWVNLAAVNFKRYGGEHNRPGNDGGCFASALASVRKWGGVLEHPAFSKAWAKYGLPRPNGIGWFSAVPGEWVCEVWHSAYGHKARKRTWLFYCGYRPTELNWMRPAGTHWIGNCDSKDKGRNKPTVTKKEANATPLAFRDALLDLAQSTQIRVAA